MVKGFLTLNRIRLAVKVENYISLVTELVGLYSSYNTIGRGLWDESENRKLEDGELLGFLLDPHNLLDKITNPGGSTIRTEERVFLIVARAFCGTVTGAATLGVIAIQRKRPSILKQLGSLKFA